MLDDLPAPIGPDIEKIIARLYPPVVQDLVETSENLMHKKITRIQMTIWWLIKAQLQREIGTCHHREDTDSQGALVLTFRKLLRWGCMVKTHERLMIDVQREGHLQRIRNILRWWDTRQTNS